MRHALISGTMESHGFSSGQRILLFRSLGLSLTNISQASSLALPPSSLYQ